MFWDFLSLRPESTHQVMFLFSDRGIPDGYRHMNGYGSHTFSLVNAKNETVYCKFHYKVHFFIFYYILLRNLFLMILIQCNVIFKDKKIISFYLLIKIKK